MPWLTLQLWKTCCDMEETLSCFKGLTKDIIKTPVHCKLGRLEVHANPEEWEGYSSDPPTAAQPTPDEGEEPPISGQWDQRLTSFQKLIMIKCFKEEKVNHHHESSLLLRILHLSIYRLYLL